MIDRLPVMFSRIVLLTSVLAALGNPTAPRMEHWRIRFDGIGPAKVGMTLSQLNIALHEHFLPPDNEEERHCTLIGTAKHLNIGFMMIDGKLVRMDVDDAGVFTVEGVQVGDSEERVLRVYGSGMKVEPHFYNGPEDHYLTIRSKDGKFGIRFETNNGRVSMFYAGTYEAIQYVEGCS